MIKIRITTFVFVFVLCFMFSVFDSKAESEETANQFAVKSESLNIYSRMSLSSKVVKELKKGDMVIVDFRVSSGEGNWCITEKVGHTTISGYVLCKFLEHEGSLKRSRETNYSLFMTDSDEDVNIGNERGETPLMIASLNCNLELVESLISKGADVNAKDDFGITALMNASGEGCLEIVKLLISKGADVNATIKIEGLTKPLLGALVKDIITPLLAAYWGEHDEIIEYLLASGAEEPAGYHVAPMTKEEIDETIRSLWINFKNALINKDIETALSYIAYQSKDMFRYNFELMQEHLPEIGQNLSDIFLDEIDKRTADYHMFSVEDGVKYNYSVQFYREYDGIWRIAFF